MRVFLTGATGYIGTAVAEAMQAAGHEVLGLARSEEARWKLAARGVEPREGDVADPRTVTEAAKGAEALIYAAQAGEGDRAAVEALAGLGKPLIYTSGVWVLGSTGDSVADESWPLNPPEIVAWRPAVEQVALRVGTVIRPAMVYGRQGGFMMTFVQTARHHGAARYVGGGENRWTWVNVDDLADLYVLLLNAPAGTLVHAAAGPAVRVREAAEAASRFAGAEGKTQPWPLESARAQLGLLADALVLDQRVSGEKARREFGWRPMARPVTEEF
ncbi:MAG: NAD-dependent epimerase/dehydratase family protein [Bryobacteraceae bacterium]